MDFRLTREERVELGLKTKQCLILQMQIHLQVCSNSVSRLFLSPLSIFFCYCNAPLLGHPSKTASPSFYRSGQRYRSRSRNCPNHPKTKGKTHMGKVKRAESITHARKIGRADTIRKRCASALFCAVHSGVFFYLHFVYSGDRVEGLKQRKAKLAAKKAAVGEKKNSEEGHVQCMTDWHRAIRVASFLCSARFH